MGEISTEEVPEATRVISLVKIFERKEYLDEFVSGRLYMNSVDYFRSAEDSHEHTRRDKFEGASAIVQPSRLRSLNIGDIVIPASNIASPVVVHYDSALAWNVFCMYGLYVSVDKSENIIGEKHEVKRSLEFCNQVMKLGPEAAVVTNPGEFFRRVDRTASQQKVMLMRGRVEYFDEDQISDEDMGDRVERALFRKRMQFSYQREYRIAVSDGSAEKRAVRLDIGDLSDIVYVCKSHEFNELLEVNTI